MQRDIFLATYEVIVQNNKLINKATGQMLKFKEGATFKFEIERANVIGEIPKKTTEPKSEKLIGKGEHLSFSIYEYEFLLELQEDLMLTKEEGKFSRLAPVKCVVTQMFKNGRRDNGFEPIEASRLGHAYTKTYNRYYPNHGSNTRNLFLTMKYEGQPLKKYRKF